jgi:drug/metabolite transporter (DMT)-like permease
LTSKKEQKRFSKYFQVHVTTDIQKEELSLQQFTVGAKGKAIFLTILAGIMWGTSFPVIKIGLNYVDPYQFVFLRFLVAALLMLALMILTKRVTKSPTQKKLVLILGVANGVAYLIQYVGMNYTSAAKASLLINLSAIWVALLSPALLSERLGSKKILGVICGIIGVFLVTTNLNLAILNEGQLSGDLLLVISGIVWAFFMIYNKKLVKSSTSLLESMTWMLPPTLIPMIPFLFLSSTIIIALPIQAWLAIFYTAIFCWIIPYYLWLEGLKSISASTSTILLLSEIVVAVSVSAIFLGEIITIISGIGALFIILAIVLVSLRSTEPQNREVNQIKQ